VVLKETSTELLLKSIRTVVSGQFWVGREAVTDLVKVLRDLVPAAGEESRRKAFGLTPRELEIVSAIVLGYTNKDIARKYSISEDTVKHHLTNIFDKVGVSNRLELALFAIEHRLVGTSSLLKLAGARHLRATASPPQHYLQNFRLTVPCAFVSKRV
jgi:DNA-binding NarL/FixJ family response regulator